MTMQQVTFLIPPYGVATLTMPELLTSEVFVRLDSAIDNVLGKPRQGLIKSAAPDPGSIEFDSWFMQRHGT